MAWVSQGLGGARDHGSLDATLVALRSATDKDDEAASQGTRKMLARSATVRRRAGSGEPGILAGRDRAAVPVHPPMRALLPPLLLACLLQANGHTEGNPSQSHGFIT